ncbi:hypothetical protein [Flexivirga oryzae]|uniref:Ribose/xylose/arabinose/galactoside ABC-type transport system permease subunit n=1 Tax=Flexivirga oryzae TaxID=1794944 RepID=A0A839N876_9MICO|nr:hypothetical protein [Flexivirga oryzae]MBB2893447.1 ribose/xylose/arabinose/galactoside ABC-type transport system permease subunit [Flexivirga oryzae]
MKGGSADPTAFSSLLLTSVATCLIGGISLYGGKVDTAYVFFGVLVLSVLTAGAAAEGAQSYVTDLFTGALLFVVLALDFVMLTLAARNKLRRRILSARSSDFALR